VCSCSIVFWIPLLAFHIDRLRCQMLPTVPPMTSSTTTISSTYLLLRPDIPRLRPLYHLVRTKPDIVSVPNIPSTTRPEVPSVPSTTLGLTIPSAPPMTRLDVLLLGLMFWVYHLLRTLPLRGPRPEVPSKQWGS